MNDVRVLTNAKHKIKGLESAPIFRNIVARHQVEHTINETHGGHEGIRHHEKQKIRVEGALADFSVDCNGGEHHETKDGHESGNDPPQGPHEGQLTVTRRSHDAIIARRGLVELVMIERRHVQRNIPVGRHGRLRFGVFVLCKEKICL